MLISIYLFSENEECERIKAYLKWHFQQSKSLVGCYCMLFKGKATKYMKVTLMDKYLVLSDFLSWKFWFGVNWGSCAISSNDGSIVSLSQMNWFDIELTKSLRMLSVLGVQGYWMWTPLCVSMYVIFWDRQSQQDRWWSPLSVPNVLLAILETRASFSVQNTAVMHLLYESCSILFRCASISWFQVVSKPGMFFSYRVIQKDCRL